MIELLEVKFLKNHRHREEADVKKNFLF